jgi:hypothetical protein
MWVNARHDIGKYLKGLIIVTCSQVREIHRKIVRYFVHT